MPIKRRCKECWEYHETTRIRVVICGDGCCDSDHPVCDPCAVKLGDRVSPE